MLIGKTSQSHLRVRPKASGSRVLFPINNLIFLLNNIILYYNIFSIKIKLLF